MLIRVGGGGDWEGSFYKESTDGAGQRVDRFPSLVDRTPLG